MTTVDLSQLADNIADLILQRTVPSPKFWNYADIANHLRVSVSTVQKRWSTLPDFPQAIRLPTGGRGLGHPIYDPAEVMAWARRYKRRG